MRVEIVEGEGAVLGVNVVRDQDWIDAALPHYEAHVRRTLASVTPRRTHRRASAQLIT